MESLIINGGTPLNGTVYLSGAKNSALKIIHAAMFSNEDVILTNVPRIGNIEVDLEILSALGAKVEWLENHRLKINGSTIDKFEIPFDLGSKYRTSVLLAGPLLYRFGQAIIPKPGSAKIGFRPLNRLIDTWKSLGVQVTETPTTYELKAKEVIGANINFKINTHMGTDNAIICALFANGETTISNAAEECEVDDLISFCNVIGGDVKRIEPDKIKVVGKNVFKGGTFTIMPDRNEAVLFSVAALVTKGNIHMVGVDKGNLLSFLSAITKIGCRYEFSGDEMTVWYGGETFSPINITTSPAPGFMTEWQPLITLLLTQCSGESLVHETIYTDRFGYTKDLNRMGAHIELYQPSTLDITPVISDDQYDLASKGEPYTVAKVSGPTTLKGVSINIPDLRSGASLLLAALCAEGVTELYGYENVDRGYDNLKSKLLSLGAKITEE